MEESYWTPSCKCASERTASGYFLHILVNASNPSSKGSLPNQGSFQCPSQKTIMHFPVKHSGYAGWNKASVSAVQMKSGLMPSYCPAKQIIFSDLPYVQMIFEEQMSLSFSRWLRGNVTIGSHCLQMRIFINGHRRGMKVYWRLSAWDKWKTPLTLKRMWKEHPLVFFL